MEKFSLHSLSNWNCCASYGNFTRVGDGLWYMAHSSLRDTFLYVLSERRIEIFSLNILDSWSGRSLEGERSEVQEQGDQRKRHMTGPILSDIRLTSVSQVNVHWRYSMTEASSVLVTSRSFGAAVYTKNQWHISQTLPIGHSANEIDT